MVLLMPGEKITRQQLADLAERSLGVLVKGVVDVETGWLALGAGMHADEEAALLEQGSKQEDLWGINLYPGVEGDDWIEFDSMINLRPRHGNRTRGVDSVETQRRIRDSVEAHLG